MASLDVDLSSSVFRFDYEFVCTTSDILELVLSVESDQWELDEITNWVIQQTKRYP
jgi:hypothetical protein